MVVVNALNVHLAMWQMSVQDADIVSSNASICSLINQKGFGLDIVLGDTVGDLCHLSLEIGAWLARLA